MRGNTGSNIPRDSNELELPILVINPINPSPIRDLGVGSARNGHRIRFRELGDSSQQEGPRRSSEARPESEVVGFGKVKGEGFWWRRFRGWGDWGKR